MKKASEGIIDLLYLTFENVQDEIYWISIDGSIITANKAACDNNHFKLTELQKLRYNDIDKYATNTNWEKLLVVLKTNSKFRYETVFKNNYKEEIAVEVSASYLVQENNEIICMICHNITKRKKAEQRLKLEEEKFRLFTEINRDTIIQLDRNCMIKYCSPIALKMFGYTIRELEKSSFFIYASVESKDFFKMAAEKVLNGEEVQTLELIMRKKNGEEIDIEAALMPFKRKSKIIGIHIILRDITDKIKRENDLDQAFLKYENIIMQSEVLNENLANEISERKKIEKELDKARSEAVLANRAKSEFLANMSHEIRTPLNAVLGFAEILKEKLSQHQEYSEYLEGIDTGGKSLLSLINDILDLSKIEAGRLEIQKEPMSITDLFAEVNQIFKNKIENKGLQLVINSDSNLPLIMELDHTRMRQVLFNLVGNAVKFTSTGTITLSGQITKKYEQDYVDIMISVADTGLGIPRKQQKLIFNPFIQKEGQSTRKFGGTGLGLTITKRLIEMMHGKIFVESRIGKGSNFIVKLNKVKISNNAEVKDTTSKAEDFNYIFENAKILLVEDNILNRQVFKGFLEQYDLDVIEAENGQMALNILEKVKPDIIFMDLRMPVLGGIETSQIIKNRVNLKYIPLIAVSASMISNYAANEIKLFNDNLQKPVSKKDLLNKLSKFLKYKKVPVEKQVNFEGKNNIQNTKTLNSKRINSEQKKIMRELYRTKFKPMLDNTHDYIDIEDILKLAELLKNNGKKTRIKYLTDVGNNLNELCKQFKVNDIELLITNIDSYFKSL